MVQAVHKYSCEQLSLAEKCVVQAIAKRQLLDEVFMNAN